MTSWQLRPVQFRFQLSDWVLFTTSLPMQVRAESVLDYRDPVENPLAPAAARVEGSQGFAIRNLPVAREQPTLSRADDYLRYIPLQYLHCYIDLSWSFDQYLQKFSSKTRSTIQRKVKKFSEHCGGSVRWKSYVRPEEIPEFFRLAREVSELTYQERLLGVGLPDTEAFRQEATALARQDQLRAFILFDDNRPISYLYCPAQNGVLIYAYLGYAPAYKALSAGTVLQWLALEQIFRERKFRYFDFTEGQSSHKQLFATHQCLCANVFFVQRTLVNVLLIHAHHLMNRFSKWLGATLDRYGLKTTIKHALRRG